MSRTGLNEASVDVLMGNTSAQIPLRSDGKVRVKEAAPFLGIAVSTFWLYVKQGRIQQPMKYGKRVSVWDAGYMHELAKNGIPDAEEAA